jgi:hypothetical protein
VLVVIVTNDALMLFPEALVAMAAMAVPILIVVISPMLPSMVVIMVPSLNGLRRQDHPSGYREKYQ